jgi:hypothetical protein
VSAPSDDVNKDIISLELLDDPINETRVVESIQYHPFKNLLSVNLNHGYKGIILVPLGAFEWKKNGWIKLDQHIRKQAERLELDNKVILYIQSILDSNYDLIVGTNGNDGKGRSGDKGDVGDGGAGNDGNSDAQLLLRLVLPGGLYAQHFFKDQYGMPYCELLIEGKNGNEPHKEIISIERSKYRRYLSKLFYDCTQQIANSEIITNVINILHAKTEYEGETIPLSIRTAWKDNNYYNNSDSYITDPVFYYDLTDPLWHVIKVSKEGWSIVESTAVDAPIKFTRYNQTPQVIPMREYPADIFDQFMNLTNVNGEQNKLLLKVYIVSLFIPEIAHVILNLHGEKGSAKTFLMWMIKILVDPSKPALLTIHKDRNEFIQQINHTYAPFYDNLKHVPDWLSDEVCKAVTGIGHTKRKLYSNDEDIVYEYKRCPGFNGINVGLTEPDALDRSILIELIRIKKKDRRLEAELIQEFERIKPQLLGYIFDVLVKTLKIRPTVKLCDLPRMADFALWGEAISRAIGYEPLQFINSYYENIGKQNLEAIETHPLGQAIAKFCEEEIEVNEDKDESNCEWEGAATKLLERLAEIAVKYKIDTQRRDWPKAVNALTYRLNIIRSNLLEGIGIEVVLRKAVVKEDVQKYGKNITVARIRKTSLRSLPSLPSQNHEGKLEDFGKDPEDSKDETSLPDSGSLPESIENHAHNPKSNDGSDGNDLFRTRLEEEEAVRSEELLDRNIDIDTVCDSNSNESDTNSRNNPSETPTNTDKATLGNNKLSEARFGTDGKKTTSSNGSSGIEPAYSTSANNERIKQVEDFFSDESDYRSLPEHSLEQSPCHPIIQRKDIFYACILHPKARNINLETIEHHCRYKEPDIHKQEILSKLLAKQKQERSSSGRSSIAP